MSFLSKIALSLLLFVFAGSVLARPPLATTAASLAIRKAINSGTEDGLDAAMEQAEAQVEAQPKLAEAYYWLGAAYGRKAQSVNMFSAASYARKVKAAFEQTIALDPQHIDAHFGLIQFYLQVPGFMGGDEEEAKRLAAVVGKIDPVAGHRARATLKFAAKDPEGGFLELTEALKIAPANGDVLAQVVALLERDKRIKDAKPYLDAAIAIAPEDFKVRYQVGKYAALSGEELPTGLAHLDAVIAETEVPDGISLAGAHWRRAQILVHLKRDADALLAARQAARIEPDSKEIKQTLDELARAQP